MHKHENPFFFELPHEGGVVRGCQVKNWRLALHRETGEIEIGCSFEELGQTLADAFDPDFTLKESDDKKGRVVKSADIVLFEDLFYTTPGEQI